MKLDPESQQMPKRSIKEDLAKSMTGEVKKLRSPLKPNPKPKKPSNMPRKQTATATATGSTGGMAASSDTGVTKPPLKIPMKDMSPEFKRLVVEELIRIGKARVVRRRVRETMAREEEEKRKKDQKK